MPNPARVLVAEVAKFGARGLKGSLLDQGCEVAAVGVLAEIEPRLAGERPDVLVVDATTLPSRDPASVAALRATARGAGVPLIVVGRAGDRPELSGGEPTGLEDFVTKPLQPAELAARVHALRRLGVMHAELERRVETARRFGFSSVLEPSPAKSPERLRVLAVEPGDSDLVALRAALGRSGWVEVAAGYDAREALLNGRHDAAIVFDEGDLGEALEICRAIRQAPNLFHFPVLLVAGEVVAADPTEPIRAGVNDVLARPIAAADLRERVIALVRLERFRSWLLDAYRQGLGLIVTDGLTGLYRFGFLHEHLARTLEDLRGSAGPLAIGTVRIPDLREINARAGYAAGDRVLRQVGAVIGRLVRSEDLAARVRGATFAILMPDTTLAAARLVCRRIAAVLASTDVGVGEDGAGAVRVVTSCAIASPADRPETLIERAADTSDLGEPVEAA
jgi:two-component system cell cycle response regulator PopA